MAEITLVGNHARRWNPNADAVAFFTGAGYHQLTARVDDADLPLVSPHAWFVKTDALGRDFAYTHVVDDLVASGSKTRHVYLHAMLLGITIPFTRVKRQHLNGDTLDNRRSNLCLSPIDDVAVSLAALARAHTYGEAGS